jgi:hypothetical protein
MLQRIGEVRRPILHSFQTQNAGALVVARRRLTKLCGPEIRGGRSAQLTQMEHSIWQ